MHPLTLLRLPLIGLFIGYSLLVGPAFSDTAKVPTLTPHSEATSFDQKIFVSPKLSQGTDYQVFTFVAAQGQGGEIVKLLPERSYYQRALVLPSSSMRMSGSIIDEQILAINDKQNPNKVGLLNRPTLIVGGSLISQDNALSPYIGFMQLRLPYVRWAFKNEPVYQLIVEAQVVGGKESTSLRTFNNRVMPFRAIQRVPFELGYRLPVGLPNEKTSQIADFEIDTSRQGFATELDQAIKSGGSISVSVYEAIFDKSDLFERDPLKGDKLYDISYSFKGEPHESANKNLNLIIGNSINALNRGEGYLVGSVEN